MAIEHKKKYLRVTKFLIKTISNMESIAINQVMRLINSLSTQGKLEILAQLSENLKLDFNKEDNKKELLLEELFGAWSDTDENLADDILKSRTISDKKIKFD